MGKRIINSEVFSLVEEMANAATMQDMKKGATKDSLETMQLFVFAAIAQELANIYDELEKINLDNIPSTR